MHFKHFTRLFLLMGMIGLMSLTSWAQQGEIQIGSGTSTDYYLPSPSAFKYAISQQIYTADEIENAGGDDDLINQIAFYNASDNQYSRNFDIYMLNTTKTAFESSSDWFAVSQNDLFFSGEVTMTSNAWTTISFTTPFSYEGNNIAIIIDDNTGTANYYSMGYLCFTTSQTQSIYNNGDTNYNPMSVTGYGITRTTKNQIRLIMEDSNTECPKPQNLSVSELSDISAKLMWNVGGSETAWNVQYKQTTDNNWSDAVTVTSPTHTLTELNPNTPYQARVQADCGSNWKKVSFTTECGPVNLPFEYGFEGAATGTSNPLPDCWNRINNASNSYYTGYPDVLSNSSWTTYSHNGSNCLRFYHNSSYMSYQIAVLPVINTTTYPMNGNQVVFWAKPSSGTDKKMQVGIMTDPVDANTFELIEEISLTSTSYDEYIVNFDSYQGQGQYIALKFAPTQSSATVYVDDFKVQAIPSCEKPRVLAASEITAHSAKLSWNGGDSNGSWQIAYSTVADFDPDNASQCNYETTTTNPFTLSGLEAETSYSFRVRTICENNDYSDWNNTVCSFTTSIACQKPTSLTVVTTSEDATLSWTPGDVNQSNWEVYYTTSPTAPTNTTQGISVNQTPSYTFTNLELETTYYAYIRSDCDSEGLSSWTEAVTIYLGYCQPAPTSVDKQGITNVTFGTGNEIVNNDQRPESKPYYGNYSSQIGAALAGSEVEVAITYQTGYTYGTLIWVDWNNDFMFEDSEIVYTGMSTNANPTTLNASFTIAQTQSAGYYRMRIGGADSYFDSYVNGNHNANHDPCYNSSYAVFHDYTLHVTENTSDAFTKDITAYTENSKDHYYLIASPIGEVNPENVTNMLANNYDLYYFDQSATDGLEWINYRSNANAGGGFNLQPGKGYLYANSENTTLTFTGVPYNGNGQFDLSYDENASLKGWNLIGNPYPAIALLDNMSYYRLNPDGNALNATTENTPVAAMEGVFVQVTEANQKANFVVVTNNGEPSKVAKLNINVTQGRATSSATTLDNAIVRFDNGSTLGKFQLNPNHTKVYIPQGGKDYAIVRSATQGEMPVNFKAEKNGSYTLNVSAENMGMHYLHLIDNMTGADVDLLANPSYTFEAKTTDYASRFRLVFEANENGASTSSATFAYYNGSNWVISNPSTVSGSEATLQVIDVMGRILKSKTLNGNAEINLNQPAGIYMLRLVNGENVKTQKIVVR